jgi:hypothetical protein
VEILYRAELGDADKIACASRKYQDRFANPFSAAERGYIDEVILPRSTRARICRALNMLRNKTVENPWKNTTTFPCELPPQRALRPSGPGRVRHAGAAFAPRRLNKSSGA